jgi:hypothetical protein
MPAIQPGCGRSDVRFTACLITGSVQSPRSEKTTDELLLPPLQEGRHELQRWLRQ